MMNQFLEMEFLMSSQTTGPLALIAALVLTGCGETTSPEVESDHSSTEAASIAESAEDSAPETAATGATANETGAETGAAPEIPLIDAAWAGNAEVVKKHIAAGANLNLRDKANGTTALIAAATMGKTETCVLLMEAGANLEMTNNQGSTVLHSAAFLCREEIVKELLARGADRNARSADGQTALDTVSGTFEEAKPVYDFLQSTLGTLGFKLDYERIEETRPKIAEMIRTAE